MFEDKIPIYVIGYPKSGTTWLKRLISDVLDSPSGSISGSNGKIVINEVFNRIGNYKVLHSHYSGRNTPKIVYIVRDFRDVLVSSFFHHYRINEKVVLNICKDKNISFFKRLFWRHIVFELEIFKLTHYWASISGGTSVIGFFKGVLTLRWLKDLKGSDVGDWSSHVNSYLVFSKNVAIIRYEDLLEKPFETLVSAFKKLDIPFSNKVINEAIITESFSKKKEEFKSKGDDKNHQFLRKGVSGDWIRFLNKRMLNIIKRRHGIVMHNLGYRI